MMNIKMVKHYDGYKNGKALDNKTKNASFNNTMWSTRKKTHSAQR
jgi:hypothetical protein